MRYKNESLPTKEESKTETQKRLKIIKEIKPELENFCEAIIIGGSVGYGKNFSVRKESDVDLIILINRNNADKILKSKLFTITPQIKEALIYFKNKEVDHFSILEKINGIEMQYHFWDKCAHYRAELLQLPMPKVYNIFSKEKKKLVGVDFSGKEHFFEPKDIKKCNYGIIHDYPAFFIDKGCFIPKQPLSNLIANPDILFTKDNILLNNIEKIWENLTIKLIKESEEKVNLNKKSILFSMYGWWNMSKESKEKITKRTQKELKKLQNNNL